MAEKSKLQDPVRDYIVSLGLKEPLHLRNNVHNQKYRKSANKAFIGFPDHAIIFKNGKTIFFEYKDGTKRKPEQIEWGNYLLSLGHTYHLIENLDQAIVIINYWNKKEP